MNYNLKEKEYYCQHCKTYVILTAINPSCEKCGQSMVVVLRSILDGSRITGNDELANIDFGTARRIRKP